MKISLFTGLILLWSTIATGAEKPKMLYLQNDRVEAVFNAESGALVRLVNRQSGWQIMSRSSLGQSFELLMPLQGKEMTREDIRFNVVKGIEQAPPSIEASSNRIIFTWSGMRTDNMPQTAQITFRGIVALTPSGLEYSGELINQSSYPVEYVSWPCIGEISIPDKSQPLLQSTRNETRQLFPRFYNQHGYWGVDYPTSTYEFPQHSFLQVNNRDQGFLFYGRPDYPCHLLLTSFELIPGYDIRDTNPESDEMDGELVRIQFKANQILYNTPGEQNQLDPVYLTFYQGNRSAGLDILRHERQITTPTPRQWLSAPLTWQKAAIGSGNDLLQQAQKSRELGVDVLQIRGWYRTSEGHIFQVAGLSEAIVKCQQLGMRIVLESNWTEVDRRTQVYAQTLQKYIMKDPFGMPYNRSYLCPLSPDVQQRARHEWLKLSALQVADGVINTDNNHCDKAYLCFDSRHGHRQGEATANGTMVLDRMMAEAIRKGNPTIATLGYGFLEGQNAIYNGYYLTSSPEHFSTHRYLHPNTPIVATVDVRNARRDINNALLNQLNIAYDLQFHNNRLEDYPHIWTYGQQVKNLRRQLAAYIWEGIFMGHNGAWVEGEQLVYAVFTTKERKRALVVLNSGVEESAKVSVKLPEAPLLYYATPEDPTPHTFSDGLKLPPQSAVIIFEK